MAEVVLFHHALGLTPGCCSFADRLRGSGHVVHTPDLYEGSTFSDLTGGIGYAEQVGFETIIERGRLAVDTQGLPEDLVYAGISLGVLPAQMLAQTRPRAKGALLVSAAVPPSEFGHTGWPPGVPAQIHMMEGDPLVAEGDLDAARGLSQDGAQLFLYEGAKHLFVDDSLPDFDPEATELVLERALDLLRGVR